MELWFLYAIGAATFASLTTILAKIGIRNVDSHLATAIRTMVVLIFAWIMVFVTGSQYEIANIQNRTWLLLLLSGLATGGSWLCFFRALRYGNVNKVVPIDKSSTILTMLLAIVFLGEPLGLVMIVGMLLIGTGTWLMLDLPKKDTANSEEETSKNWLVFAMLAAALASLVAIFGKIGVADIDANLWTAIRTTVVVPLSWIIVFIAGSQNKIGVISFNSLVFLILSGIATGISWLFFYNALQLGNASHVVPVDKLSIVLTMGFARLFLGEEFSKQSLVGLGLLTVGTLLPVFIV